MSNSSHSAPVRQRRPASWAAAVAAGLALAACGPADTDQGAPGGDSDLRPPAGEPAAPAGADVASYRDIEVRNGQEALARLLAGNERFVSGTSRHDHQSQARRLHLARGQKPFGIVLGCADSRVSPEILFDVGLGDLFVIRVAGNVACIDEAGSIEYAVNHLGVPLVMVLGHDGCGAVTAVLDHAAGEEPKELEHLLGDVRRGVGELDPNDPMRKRIQAGVEANVRYQVELLRRNSGLEKRPDGKVALFVGAVYDVETGKVRVLEDDGVQRVAGDDPGHDHEDH